MIIVRKPEKSLSGLFLTYLLSPFVQDVWGRRNLVLLICSRSQEVAIAISEHSLLTSKKNKLAATSNWQTFNKTYWIHSSSFCIRVPFLRFNDKHPSRSKNWVHSCKERPYTIITIIQMYPFCNRESKLRFQFSDFWSLIKESKEKTKLTLARCHNRPDPQ